MEDHRDAYFFWSHLGFRGATCIHVDAHLDISNFTAPYYEQHRPEINCANFLAYACQEGLVNHVVWVIPPHLRDQTCSFVEWAQLELQRWMNLSIPEYCSVREELGRIEGILAGARLTICESDNLPPVSSPLLLDIDIDYFLGEADQVWQTPLKLRQQLVPLGIPNALTVAYSVQGGYTPLGQRYLGNLTLLAHTGREAEAARLWNLLHSPEVFEGAAPPWLEAAAWVHRGLTSGSDHRGPDFDRAAATDSHYRVSPADVASMYQMRGDFSRCREWLDRVGEEGSLLALYAGGFAALRSGDAERAVALWRTLLEHPQCSQAGRNRSHALDLLGRALQRLEQWPAAEECFHQSAKLDPQSAPLFRELARCQAAERKWEQAARNYRKSLGLAPEELGSLEARLELAQVYQQLGQLALGQAECRRITNGLAPPLWKGKAEALSWRLERS